MNEKRDTLQNARNYAAERRRKQRWLRAVTVMAAVVVFCTTYALILPAITLEKKCEIPEHTHTDACYTQVTGREVKTPACPLEIHTHTEECLDEENHLSCGYADFVVHQHDAACYDEGGNLWCTLPEIEAHQHEDACYAVPEAHVHDEGCYARERGELICTESTEPLHWHSEECYTESREISCEEEHEHTEECYTVQRELTCGQTEEPAHTHGDGCYEWTEKLTCGLSTEPGEPVLVCGMEEVILHTHEPYENEENPGCCDADGNLICGMTEVLEHQHTDACYETVTEPVDTQTLTCTLPEDENHTHGPLCYGTWELSCTMEEHTHSEACMDEETEPSEEETQPTEEETKPVYICGLEEHTHDASCMDESLTRICGLPEHTHTDACTVTESEYLCDQEVHTHEEACRDEAGNLICGMEEHVHTDACLAVELTEEERAQVDEMVALIDALPTSEKVKESLAAYEEAGDEEVYESCFAEVSARVQEAYARFEELGQKLQKCVPNRNKLLELEWLLPATTQDEIFTLSARTESGIEVIVSGPIDSLPYAVEKITLTAEEIASDTAETIRDQALEKEGLTAEKNYLFDVTLWYDGQQVEPIGPVTLNFIGLPLEEAETLKVYHIDEEAEQAADMNAVLDNANNVVLDTDHFSTYSVSLLTARRCTTILIPVNICCLLKRETNTTPLAAMEIHMM